ncbi:class I SAM-dependent rRNA methyltransferase [Humisphaera borealis]|uniref:Class I SAM-dependent rRNA methyltransferase n=1 Tax=Humisphaera borealis TaxID=2807512 RepID=A0A7M2WRN4_9BACT|nr:class I SAM-dependent rRNA methyltransferase [Humisphaera borealis]QOV88187.1 class I SAM-dependent rRNA methyltransferase [Humisphaera borealis]
MSFIRTEQQEPVRLRLVRDRTRVLKQGYPWIFRDWLKDLPAAPVGSRAVVFDKDSKLLAFGMYDPAGPLAVRVCGVDGEKLNDDLVLAKLDAALELRHGLFDEKTTGFRLVGGEGDGLPGLTCDLYGDHAVLKLDGDAPSAFWNVDAVADWLAERLSIANVYLKFRSDAPTRGRAVRGKTPTAPVEFLENGKRFAANLVDGQKTGFFFDQRDNRARIGDLARGRTVLNLFSYTGGFSIYAGVNGATDVTSVDQAKPATEDARLNWRLNDLPEDAHHAVAADVFQFLEESRAAKRTWDLVIVDPPSFAPAARYVEKATQSYQTLFASALGVVAPGGIIALSSCSSHISSEMFFELSEVAVSRARRRATVLGVFGQPADHPFPLVCRELQYLKLILLQVR